MDNSFDVFPDKPFSSLCKDIYDRSVNKHEQLDLLISELRPMIRKIEDAQQLVPLIQGYLEISVRNDEQLVKLAQVVQRLQSTRLEKGGMGDLLTEAEKDALWKEVADMNKEVSQPVPSTSSMMAAMK